MCGTYFFLLYNLANVFTAISRSAYFNSFTKLESKAIEFMKSICLKLRDDICRTA